ncbi:MAG: PAS domain S-box protein [Ignavibacteriales bacterium]|nr:PAS domain S-box protein [Ignavibacteriales bacterium]MCF8316406.1 PAS domain S-box protein [Ignavibacteriales bacterium]MCF8437886.1 PAS domain S-box protein [Ignavibacteriales bacterium]
MRSFLRIRLNLIILVTFCSTYTLSAQDNLTEINLQLKCKHQFQNAGYYAAIEKGYFQSRGLKVNLIEPPSGNVSEESVFSEDSHFGIASTQIIMERSPEKPVVILAPIFQRSPLVLLASRSAGIKHVEDLQDKRIMFNPNSAALIDYLKENRINTDKLNRVGNPLDINDLINGKADAITGYASDDIFTLDQAHFNYIRFTPSDNGALFYGDCIYTTEIMVKEYPKLVKDFLEASLEGWKYALNNHEEMIDLILEKYSERYSREHLSFEADKINEFVLPDLVNIGYSNEEKWHNIIATYERVGLLKNKVSTKELLYQNYIKKPPQFPTGLLLIFIIGLGIFGWLAYFFHSRYSKLKTEAALAEETRQELRKSEEKFRMLAHYSDDVIWSTNEKMILTYVSPSIQKLTGYLPEEYLALGLIKRFTNDSALLIQKRFRELFDKMKVGIDVDNSLNLEMIRKNGELIWTETKLNLMQDSSGAFIGFIGVTRDVTEKKRILEELISDKSFLSELINSIPSIIFVKDMDGKYLLVNDNWRSFTGISREFTLGKTDFEIFPKDIAEQFRMNDLFAIRQRKLIEIEEVLVQGQDTMHFFSAKFPLENERGEIYGVCGIATDITQRKRNEKAIKESEELWRKLFELSPDGIATTSAQGILLSVSRRTIEMWGYDDSSELLGRHITEFITPAFRERSISIIKKLLKGQFSGPQEFLMLKKDGSTFFCETKAEILRDQNGKINGLIFVSRDITERKRFESILMENENRLRVVFENAPIGIVRYDKSGVVLSCNDQFAELLGSPKEVIIGFNFHNLPDDRIKETFKKCYLGETAEFEGNYTSFTGNKSTFIRMKISPVYTADNEFNGAVAIVEDFTERREAKEKIRRYAQELENLNIEKDKFFAIIAHDLRSPFQSFLGITEIMAEDIDTFSLKELQELSNEMRKKAQNLFKLLKNLLEWAQIKQGKVNLEIKKVDVKELVERTLGILGSSAENKKITIQNNIGHSLFVLADENMITSVLMNLITNAVKFTPREGRIIIAYENSGNGFVNISIEDTGIGIPSTMKENLFNLDVKTGRKGTEDEPTTGLGLLLSKEFISKNGGELFVESEPGKGSIFSFTLPQADI